MKKYSFWLLVVLFALLSGFVWYLYEHKSDQISLLMADRDFAIKDSKRIHKVFIANRSTEPITLEKKEGVWFVNGKYKANPNSMNNLLQTLQDIRLQAIPSKGHIKGIMEGIAVHGIKVEVYGEDEEILKTYYVGGSTISEYGTYYYMEHGNQPYIMELPHFVGNVRERFDLNLNDWRDRSVVDIEGSRIEEVSLEYPDDPNASFILRKQENQFELYDFVHQQIKLNTPGQKLVNSYLEHFKGIGAEAIQNSNPKRKEYSSLKPFCILGIKESGNKAPLVLRFIPIATDSFGIANPEVRPIQMTRGQIFKLHVDRSDGDFLMVQYPVVEPLLITKQDFLK